MAVTKARMSRSQAIALMGQRDEIDPNMPYPHTISGEPIVDQYSALQSLLCAAHKIPRVADPGFVPPVIIHDLFTKLDTAQWATIDDGATGTNTLNDVLGGEVGIVTAAADDDYHFMVSPKVLLFDATRPMVFEAQLRLTEPAVDTANWIVGVSSIKDATLLGAAGAGPAAAYSGAVFFKVDGTLKIYFETSLAGAQVTQDMGTFTSAAVYRVGFHYDPNDGVTAKVTPYLNGVAGTAHNLAISGLAAMAAVYGLKAGSINATTLNMRRYTAVQKG